MKKIILSAVVLSMLLPNVAFASTKSSNVNSGKDSNNVIIQTENVIKVNTQDPRG